MGTWKLSHAPCSQFFLGTEAHLAASIIKLDFLMCSNFLLHLAKPSRCQSQSLSDDCPYSQILFGRLPLAACTSTQHQVRGCISTHPLPNLNFIFMTAGCWVATAGRTSRPCQNPDTGCRCTEWHRVPSPHWHGSPPGHLVPLEHVPVTHRTRPPACLQDTALCWSLQTSFAAPAATSSPPFRRQWVICCPGTTPWDLQSPTCHTVVV